MMRIPQLVAALLALRDVSPLLPDTYCLPECPSCKVEIGSFNVDTSCTAGSSFITDCGSCQQCIITYAIENGPTPNTEQLDAAMINILNFCQNTTVSAQISALQSQASKLSMIAVFLSSASKISATATTSMSITAPGSRFTYSDARETWTGPYDYQRGSAAPTSTTSLPTLNNTLNFLTPSVPYTPPIYLPSTSTPLSSTRPPPAPQLSSVWIVGPVMGSLLGICTVIVVIFFTRRKQRLSPAQSHPLPSQPSSPAKHSFRSSTSPPPSPEPDPQPHLPARELDTYEIHELAAMEPVGSELLTPRDAPVGEGEERGEFPLPMGAVPALFAMSELRDQRAALADAESRHQTFYHA